MPGPVFRGSSAEPVAIWRDGKLLDQHGVGTMLSRRGSEWFAGASSKPRWRQQGNIVFNAGSSDPAYRVVKDQVYRGNGYETVFRIQDDALMRGAAVVLRGPGLTGEELLLAALVLAV